MMFPKDRTVYSSLNTSFTSFEALLADLQARHHTGYVEVTFPGYTGTLLMSEGEVVNACELTADARLTGAPAVRAIATRATERDGTVNVWSAFPDVVLLLHRLMDSRPLYRDLTSAFTSLDRLIAKLRGDGLTGYVEVHVTGNQGVGVVYLSGGEPVESVFSTAGGIISGQEALDTIVQTVNTIGGSFNVFVEPSAGAAAAPEQPAPAAAAPAQDTHREPLLAFWGEVLATVESVADSYAKPGRFHLALKEVLVSRAVTYPFLDPFAAEFEYAAGAIEFHGQLPDDFNKALGDCLSDTVSKLAFQLKRSDLEEKVRARLAAVSEKHAAVVDRFNLREDFLELVA
ncbi:MAG TPA: hypothetical protein PL082_00040 [Tepidiformaceae bacterium]|nr:hypothetical protein [Tepidiformaceae bacterium]